MELESQRSRTARAGAVLALLVPGALTTAVALAAVFFSTEAGTNLMLYHVSYVIPAGAILVGLVSSSGFTVGARFFGVKPTAAVMLVIGAARFFGVKPTAAVMLVIGAALVGAYLGAEYIGFRVRYPNGVLGDDGTLLGFWGYFDALTRLTHFGSGKALGLSGYLVRAVGMSGFVAAGIVGPVLGLSGRAHCGRCQRYMKGTIVGYLTATDEAAIARIEAQRNDPQQLGQQLHAAAPSDAWAAASQTSERILFRVLQCPSCGEGAFVSERLIGLPDQTEGREVSRNVMSASTIETLFAAWNQARAA